MIFTVSISTNLILTLKINVVIPDASVKNILIFIVQMPTGLRN